MKKVFIKTFGCQMNMHDSERMLGVLRKEGYIPVEEPKSADLILFNTCSIRQKAEQKFYSQLGRMRQLKRKNPALKVAVAGCIAQQEGRALKERASVVDYVIGPQNIGRVGEVLSLEEGIFTDENPDIATADLPALRSEGISARVNIMYGCNNFCTYCVVPYTRGRETSRPANSILNEVRGLSAQGYKEVTLLGQNVNSYSGDASFPELLRMISYIDGIERIRFVTSHPKDLSDELIYAIRDLGKVCEHIHLPLQSGSDRMLMAMNRRYTYSEYLRKIEKLRREIPEIAITSDIIAGFPDESDKDHDATVRSLKEIEFDGIFAFKFSPRPMTKASEMDGQIPDDIKSVRLKEILRLQDGITEKKNMALVGKTLEILIEGTSESVSEQFTGRTRTNKIVNLPQSENIMPNSLILVHIKTAHRHSLIGAPDLL